jgi:hypothetical protein
MLRVRAVFYMFLGASLAGIALCILGALIGAAVLRGNVAGFGALVGGLMGGILGFPLGTIAGIVLIHIFFHYKGSVWFGVLGCIIGAAIVIGIAGPLRLTSNTDVLALCFLLAPPVLGTTGYFLGAGMKKKKGQS